MNKKIQELADQVAEDMPGVYNLVYESGSKGVEFSEEALGKFAELIVLECAEYANWYQANSRYTDIAKAIKEHFGIQD